MVESEQSALLNPQIRPAAKVGDAPGPVPPANSYFGMETFLEDIKDTQNGTVPISVLIASAIGVFCGISCTLYYKVLKGGFWLFWTKLPEYFELISGEALAWTWIPIVVLTLSVGVGLSIQLMGDPGDLKYTIKRVHENGFIPVSHAPSMVVASLASIVGAGSLGPEAPLVAICASVGGWVSRTLFRQRYKNLVRKHTLCGMACATAGFFGVPLGGALFALEVNNRLGYEYFEHALISIFSGTVCLVVFRGLTGVPIGPVWELTKTAQEANPGKSVAHMLTAGVGLGTMKSVHNASEPIMNQEEPVRLVAEIAASTPQQIIVGGLLGLLGAVIAFCFVQGHKALLTWMDKKESLRKPLPRAVFGGLGICAVGLLIPHTLFWGEFELQTIAYAGEKVKDLPHLWPEGGATNLEITGWFTAFLVGVGKLVAISITVASGYRGGFIFPFFCAGAGFGRAITYIFPSIHPVVAALTVGAGINATITRTALATPLILAALAGEPNAAPPILAASLCAVFATAYLPFISSQRGRDNIFEAQLHSYTFNNFFDEKDAPYSEMEADNNLLDPTYINEASA